MRKIIRKESRHTACDSTESAVRRLDKKIELHGVVFPEADGYLYAVVNLKTKEGDLIGRRHCSRE